MRKKSKKSYKICESRNGKRLAENDSTELVVSDDAEGIVCGFILFLASHLEILIRIYVVL